ncbi:MAG: hypothetical protein ACI81R_003642 [Bradymonadia bacterium]|jgi:hypothetical protein
MLNLRTPSCLAFLPALLFACVESNSHESSPIPEAPAISRPDPSICGADVSPEGWVCAPPGRFELGAGGCYGDPEAAFATRVYVTLTKPIWVAERAVTNGEWRALMLDYIDENQLSEPAERSFGSASYGASLLFANRLSELEGLSPCYDLASEPRCRPFNLEGWTDFDCEIDAAPGLDETCTGYRLPTVAENEWIVRAGGALDWPLLNLCRPHPWFADGCHTDVSIWLFDRTLGWDTTAEGNTYFPPGEYVDPLLHRVLGIEGGWPITWRGERARSACHDTTTIAAPREPGYRGLRLVRTATEGAPLADEPLR